MKRFSNILCVVEPEDTSRAAIIRAVSLAKSHQAQLTVISVVQTSKIKDLFSRNRQESENFLDDLISKKKEALDAFVKTHGSGVLVEINVLTGIQFIEVIRDVIKNQRDLVVKCPDQENWFERLFGSDDMHLLRKCPCPVLMLKPDMLAPCQKILATVDISDNAFDREHKNRVQDQLNKYVLEFSSSFALAESAELHIGSVWEAYGEEFLRYSAFSKMPEEEIDKYVEITRLEMNKKLEALVLEMESNMVEEAINYIRPQTHLVKGLPAKEIPIMAQTYDIDLIVMGTVARVGVPGFIIGNTAEAILEQVNCSVLAIKPTGFQSPVLLI